MTEPTNWRDVAMQAIEQRDEWQDKYDAAEATLRALRAQIQGDQPWQPIETAPKDGSWLWMRSTEKTGGISAFKWDASHKQWFAGTGWWPQVHRMFTHWKLLSVLPPDQETP